MFTGETLFAEALKHVESASIRDWATSDRNRSSWLQLAARAAATGKYDAERFAAYMVATAMGF